MVMKTSTEMRVTKSYMLYKEYQTALLQKLFTLAFYFSVFQDLISEDWPIRTFKTYSIFTFFYFFTLQMLSIDCWYLNFDSKSMFLILIARKFKKSCVVAEFTIQIEIGIEQRNSNHNTWTVCYHVIFSYLAIYSLSL